MTKVLIVDSAATGDASVSRKITSALAARLGAQGIETVRRDVGNAPVPHLTADTVGAIRGAPAESEAAVEALALSDSLVAEIQESDVIVIGAPMYNFGMASTLKAWFDHVLRARVTFRYTENGPEGLVTGKKAIVVETRAGVYSDGASSAMDFQEPHIRGLLGFMGITDVTFVRAEGLAFEPEAAAQAVAEAEGAVRAIFDQELALAA